MCMKAGASFSPRITPVGNGLQDMNASLQVGNTNGNTHTHKKKRIGRAGCFTYAGKT